ncbi:MAG: hypothetical protein J0M24_18530 [Verrucomicrobia bacterium]|nr:hypothetical protein [Verrucomicrobiota bacterium]
MRSSISHSDRKIPWMAFALLATGVLVWGLEVIYTLRWNPELQFLGHAYRIKSARAERISAEGRSKWVILGGSSSFFSIDTELLGNLTGRPAVNFGLAAGIGPSVLSQAAVQFTQSGDTLLVALEPVLLTDSMEPPGLGVQFSFVAGHPEWFSNPTIGTNRVPWPSALLALRPGGYHTLTMLGKLVRGGALYRYSARDVRADGFAQTDVRVDAYQAGLHSGRLPLATRNFLRALREWCDARKITAYYVLPWSYSSPDEADGLRHLNVALLMEVMEFLPVIKDPRLGVYPVGEHFADSGYHLNQVGATIRTQELADLLKNKRIWARQELADLALVERP